MNTPRHRPLPLDHLRAFEAVARRLSFSQAADELHLTQPAISRQIKALEDSLGAPLFSRGTRRVELTAHGSTLLRTVAPWLDRLDAQVRQIRQARGRRVISLSTFASFASMWLLPQMEAFQREHGDIDIRVSATDHMIANDDPDFDLALRHVRPEMAPPGAVRLFDEVVTPVVSPRYAEQSRAGQAPPLAKFSDLAHHALVEEDSALASAEWLGWQHWLREHGEPRLQPLRWLYLNFTYQQIQAALAGQGVALARVALVTEALARGDLVEPFGSAGRLPSTYAYWLIASPASRSRPEVTKFCEWIESRAALTRAALLPPQAPFTPLTPPRARSPRKRAAGRAAAA